MRHALVILALFVALFGPRLRPADYLRAVDTPKTELLWPNGAPGALGTEDLDKPAITFYQPAKPQATGTIVVICPGGGYRAWRWITRAIRWRGGSPRAASRRRS